MVLLRTRDYHAFVELFDRHRAGVASFAGRMTGDADEAEAIAHDTFVEMAARAPAYSARKPFRPWLYSIAHEFASARLAKHDPAPGSNLQALARARPEGEAAPSSDQADRAKPVVEALWRMKPVYREVACLRIFERMSYEDIAAATGERVKTVLGRMSYAVEQLRKAMPRQGGP